MVKSDKNYDVSCKSRAVCLFIVSFVKLRRCDDNNLGEQIGIKPHLEPLDLQGELIILMFLFNRMLKH